MDRLRAMSALLAASLVALVVAHNLDFLLMFGRDAPEALLRSGHGPEWTSAVTIVLAGAAVFLILMAWRVHRLRRLAEEVDPSGFRAPVDIGDIRRRLFDTWLRLAAATTALFVVQENIEHYVTTRSAPGLGVLGTLGDPHAFEVIALVSLAVALVVVLYRYRRDVLLHRIVAALRRIGRRVPGVLPLRAVIRDRRPESIVGRRRAGRAPPVLTRP